MASERDGDQRASFGQRLSLLLTIGPGIYFLDWISKWAVRNNMEPYGDTIPVIDGLAKLHFIYNDGIVFGLDLGVSRWILVAMTAMVAVFLLWYILSSDYSDRPGLVALCLIAGGALGNLHDRIMAGRVVDFIEIGWREYTWPVFNVADIAVTVGALLLALRMLRESRSSDRNTGENQPN